MSIPLYLCTQLLIQTRTAHNVHSPISVYPTIIHNETHDLVRVFVPYSSLSSYPYITHDTVLVSVLVTSLSSYPYFTHDTVLVSVLVTSLSSYPYLTHDSVLVSVLMTVLVKYPILPKLMI